MPRASCCCLESSIPKSISVIPAPALAGVDETVATPRDLQVRLTQKGIAILNWKPGGSGIAGYRVLVSDYPPDEHRGHFLELEGGTSAQAIRAGDLAIVSKTFTDASRARYHSNRVWDAGGETALLRQPTIEFFPDEDPNLSWALVQHAPDTPVDEPGRTYLELKLSRGARTTRS